MVGYTFRLRTRNECNVGRWPVAATGYVLPAAYSPMFCKCHYRLDIVADADDGESGSR